MQIECKDCEMNGACGFQKRGNTWCDSGIRRSCTKLQYQVLVKFTKDKEAMLLMFDAPVHIVYSLLTSQVGIHNEKNECLFLANCALIDYCQILTDNMVTPEFLTKHMNIPLTREK